MPGMDLMFGPALPRGELLLVQFCHEVTINKNAPEERFGCPRPGGVAFLRNLPPIYAFSYDVASW